MNPVRRRRMGFVVALVAASALSVTLIAFALPHAVDTGARERPLDELRAFVN